MYLESELLRQKKLACFLSSETGKVVVEGISSHTSKNLGHGFYCYVYCIVALVNERNHGFVSVSVDRNPLTETREK